MKAFVLLSVCVGVLMGASGCGKSSPAVKGTVTYQGEKLRSGEIRFFGAGLTRSALIGADGSYAVTDCPSGEVKVAVLSFKTEGPAPVFGKKNSAPAGLAAPTSAIPEKYNDPETSGLVYQLKPGTQKIDIPLTD